MLRSKNIKRLLLINILLAVLATIYFVQIAKRHMPCKKMIQRDISCHFLPFSSEDLPPFDGPEAAEGTKKSKANNRRVFDHQNVIFFHETSCRGWLTVRQACSVESAARSHPRWTIYVLFSAPIVSRMSISYPNLVYRRINMTSYLKGTPLEKLEINRTRCKFTDAADILRYTTLFKYPGVYLDLDMIVTKSLDRLGRNFAVRMHGDEVGSGVLALGGDAVGRSIATAAARDIAENFTYRQSSNNGPAVITRVLNTHCNTTSVFYMDKQRCKGFSVHNSTVTFPDHKSDSQYFFLPGEFCPEEDQTTYIYHFFNQYTRCFSLDEYSLFHILAKKYCPRVYASDPRQFGWNATIRRKGF